MQFKDIQPNFQVYILDKTDIPVYKTGRVTKRGTPRYLDASAYQTMQSRPIERVIDLTVECEGAEQTYAVFESQSVMADSKITLATQPEFILKEADGLYDASRSVLENIDRYKQTAQACEQIRERLNPSYAESKRDKEELAELKNEMAEIKSMLMALGEGQKASAGKSKTTPKE